jgi:hypothetical protein
MFILGVSVRKQNIGKIRDHDLLECDAESPEFSDHFHGRDSLKPDSGKANCRETVNSSILTEEKCPKFVKDRP